jgi:RNA polymerase sigma factor (sigma-70 family)
MYALKALEATRSIPPRVAQLLAANYPRFLRFLERRVGRRDVAEDILQDTLAHGLNKLATLRDDEASIAWFYQALRNATIDFYRREKLTARVCAQLAEEVARVEESTDTELANACHCATRLADGLKPEYADALRRVEIEGASIKTFAAERGISKSNAAVRVFRARETLRRELAASCGTSAAQGCASCDCAANEAASTKTDRASTSQGARSRPG